MTYCVYLTVYSGSRMPPFYIGSSSSQKVKAGYHGSVKSYLWMNIWREELVSVPELFRTVIISEHSSRIEAYKEEEKIQRMLNVVHSDLFINEAFANGNFSNHGKPRSPEASAKSANFRRGKPLSEETKLKISLAKKGKKFSAEHIENMRGPKHSDETKAKMSAIRKGVPKTDEHKAAISDGLKRRKEQE